jgi:hypothetical protein
MVAWSLRLLSCKKFCMQQNDLQIFFWTESAKETRNRVCQMWYLQFGNLLKGLLNGKCWYIL